MNLDNLIAQHEELSSSYPQSDIHKVKFLFSIFYFKKKMQKPHKK